MIVILHVPQLHKYYIILIPYTKKTLLNFPISYARFGEKFASSFSKGLLNWQVWSTRAVVDYLLSAQYEPLLIP